MKNKVLLFLSVLPVIMMFRQNQYVVKLNRAEMVSYNKTMCNLFKIDSFKYNRTQTAVNITIHLKEGYIFDNNLQIQVQAFKFASNEYRLFPLRFLYNFCEAAATNDFGLGSFFRCGTVSGCPIKEKRIFLCNWIPNASRFPPLIPAGDYRQETKIFLDSAEVANTYGYAVVKYPECKGCPV